MIYECHGLTPVATVWKAVQYPSESLIHEIILYVYGFSVLTHESIVVYNECSMYIKSK